MLYPDKETADEEQIVTPRTNVMVSVAFCAQRFGKHVSYTEKNISLLILNNEEKYTEVLAGDRKGWIINEDWLNLKEIG